MQRTCDEDSGRSSCSAGSFGISPIVDIFIENQNSTKNDPKRLSLTREASTNTELKVSLRPRSLVGLLSSPDERDPFPSCRITRPTRNAVIGLFNSPRKGGLTNAHSTLDIASSTQIEHPALQNNAISLSAVNPNCVIDDQFNLTFKENLRNHIRKPIQRAASRLYKAETSKGVNKNSCTGPEFIVRASQPIKHIDLPITTSFDKKTITIILLNGQRVEVACDPNITTAGHIFQAIIKLEKYEHNFMLGMAVLMNGDFIFLPDEYKMKKVAPEGWYSKQAVKKNKIENQVPFIVFLRIKFFLPTNVTKNIQGGEWRYRVYLQLRRATVEGQLTSTLQNLIYLAGYALHIEFGDFSYREHGSSDYFLLEHYLPEGSLTTVNLDVKLRMKRAHESRRGMDREKAILNYIILAQTFRDYGAHFYSAVWATRDGFCREVWLSIGPRGITLYSRNSCISALPQENFCGNLVNRIVLQSLPWHHIHTFYFNKKTLYIMPNSHSGLSKMGVKYKLRMTDNKSYFTFWIASLHHRLYLKLYAKEDFVNCLSGELNFPIDRNSSMIDEIPSSDCSNYQDSYNLAVRNPQRLRRQVKKRFRLDIFPDRKIQNKENEKPSTEKMLREILAQQSDDSFLNESENSRKITTYSSNDGLSSSESCSLPRRHGVKMGTRAFNGTSKAVLDGRHRNKSFLYSPQSRSDVDLATTQSDSDDLNSGDLKNCTVSMKLLPQRQYGKDKEGSAYVIESPKVCQDAFNYDNNESFISTSLFDKLDSMGCVQGERVFVTAALERDDTGALGMQVAEGSDGNVYIKSITPQGAADLSNKLLAGDQIISVNGQTLLNIEYKNALAMLQSAPKQVELIVLQNTTKNTMSSSCLNINPSRSKGSLRNIADSLTDLENIATTGDEEIINEEALKTIYTLIKLTKQNVIMRMKEKSNLSTPNKMLLQKCLSENMVYDESDIGDFSSQEVTPQKKKVQFSTWRGRVQNHPKRRPLSLNVPADMELSESYLKNLENANEKKFESISSLKKVQTSLQNLDNCLSHDNTSKTIPLPRNFGLSRKWLGPVRYPVTPCKNGIIQKSSIDNENKIVKRHFVYGIGDSDEDQIFL